MFDFLIEPSLYIKLILGLVLLGTSVFSIILFNRIRLMNKVVQISAGKIFELAALLLFLLSVGLLLTTLVIL